MHSGPSSVHRVQMSVTQVRNVYIGITVYLKSTLLIAGWKNDGVVFSLLYRGCGNFRELSRGKTFTRTGSGPKEGNIRRHGSVFSKSTCSTNKCNSNY